MYIRLCNMLCFFYGTTCLTALERLESKLNPLVRIICGLRKRDSIRAVRERNQILTVKELHLKEILVNINCFEKLVPIEGD